VESKIVKFEKVLNLFNGYAFKSTDAIESSNTQLIRMGNLYQNKLDLERKPIFYPDSYAQKYSKYVLQEGDLIISLTGTSEKEDYGFIVKISKTNKKLLLNQRVARIDIILADVNHDYILYFLRSRIFLTPLYLTAKGMKQANLSTNAIKQLNVVIPPPEEQRKIAWVLSLVQDAIAQQEQLFTLTTELKTALMQKLFTEGTCDEPQKMTEIGLIPESWDVQKLGQVVKLKSGGTPRREKLEYWDNGSIPWVKTTEINYSLIQDIEEYITQKGLDNSSANIFPKGTLLMAMYGQGVTRGRVGILDIDAATNQACVAITPDSENEISSKFLYYYFTYHYENLRQLGHGANQSNLSATILKGFTIAFPKPELQIEISDILEKIDIKLEQHQQKINCLKSLFQTLLHQLMTAKTRVDDLNLSVLNLELQGGDK
jgi:type I restriction enzyme S subunit